MPDPIPHHRDPLKLPGDPDWELEFGGEQKGSLDDESPAVDGQKVWYVRVGQALSEFFSSVRAAFGRLWNAARSAGESVARFCSGKGTAADAERAMLHVKRGVPTQVGDIDVPADCPGAPTIYFPLPEARPEPPPEEGMLGAIPKDSAVAEPATTPPNETPSSPGADSFTAYLKARSEGRDVSAFLQDEDCLKYAGQRVHAAAQRNHLGLTLNDEEQGFRDAARALLDASSMQVREAVAKAQREAAEAERLRKAAELAAKQPGQAAFEELTAAFVRHREDNRPFVIHDGSKYLADDCHAYGLRQADPSPDARAALEYLKLWRQAPDAARQRLAEYGRFLGPDELRAFASLPATEPGPVDPSSAAAVAAPPPLPPQPRWRVAINNMPDWSQQQLSAMAGIFAMRDGEVEKAMAGLRALVRETSLARPAAPVSGSAPVSPVERRLNYDAEAERRLSEMLDSLELARTLMSKLPAHPAPALDEQQNTFFRSLGAGAANINRMLEEKIGELLPAKKQASPLGSRIPALVDLTQEQAEEGGSLFDAYVQAYAKLGNSPTYALPDQSRYLKPECLSFAQAFVDEVGRFPKGAEVDSVRLQASVFLLARARQSGLGSA